LVLKGVLLGQSHRCCLEVSEKDWFGMVKIKSLFIREGTFLHFLRV